MCIRKYEYYYTYNNTIPQQPDLEQIFSSTGHQNFETFANLVMRLDTSTTNICSRSSTHFDPNLDIMLFRL